MGQLSSRPKASDVVYVHEPQTCVLLKYTTITAENHSHLFDETPVCDAEIEEGRKEKIKRFWRFFSGRKNGKYNLAPAEEVHQNEAGSFRRITDDQTSMQICSEEVNDLQEAPASETLLTPEEQLEQDILQPQDVDSPDSLLEDDDAEEMGTGHIYCRYKSGHTLGEGGFGFVNAGTRCKDGLKVAVKYTEKTPHMPYITVPGHPKRLPMEIGLTFMVNKGPRVPEIIKLLDWQDDPDHYTMVMERPSPCMDLYSFVKLHGGSLKEETARHVMQQAIHAANISCERGVFHRDIKLKNLLVNQDTMEVKLIDFGCGALMKDTAYVAFHGTKVNCPPEFDSDGEYFAKPTTVWLLGILLFKMVCGYHPSAHDLSMISANNWSRPGLSQECCQMICASLQSNPQQRLVLEEMRLHDWFKVME